MKPPQAAELPPEGAEAAKLEQRRVPSVGQRCLAELRKKHSRSSESGNWQRKDLSIALPVVGTTEESDVGDATAMNMASTVTGQPLE